MNIQPRGYQRIPSSSAFTRELRKAVEREADRFDCSRSFVIAVAVANQLGVKLNYDYKRGKK